MSNDADPTVSEMDKLYAIADIAVELVNWWRRYEPTTLKIKGGLRDKLTITVEKYLEEKPTKPS